MATPGGRIVVAALEDEGVPFAFGIPGTHNIELYDALAESDTVRPILVTDEQAASFAADGVWRASGRLGCVNVVPGAGLTHAMSGIAEAWMDTVPMLVLGCGIRTDTGHGYQLHDVDQMAMVAPVTKAQYRPTSGEELYTLVREACRVAREGVPGPVYVEVPANLYVFTHEVDLQALREAAGPAERRVGPAPDPDLVAQAAGMLDSAERPLLYLGLGALPALEHLVALAERLEAPVATTFQGQGVFPETHPLWLWPGFGEAAPPFVRKLARESDLVLAVGARFGEVGTGSYGLEMPGPLVQVDIDPDALGRNYPAAVAIHADSALAVPALLDALKPRARDARLRDRIAEGHRAVEAEWADNASSDRVTPHALIRALQRKLGPRTVYTTDSGNGTFLAMELLRLEGPRRFLAPVDYSCMGYSVPAAVGAALAVDAPVVALAGDGAFLMTGLEMLTAAHYQIPAAILVLRDRELAQIAQIQGTAFNRKTASQVHDYDLESLAAGFGVRFARIATDADIGPALDQVVRVTGEGRPIVVEVEIDYSRKTYFTRGIVKTNLKRLPWKDRIRFVTRALGRRITG